jgi:mannosyltransferase OCH1-like enzyme
MGKQKPKPTPPVEDLKAQKKKGGKKEKTPDPAPELTQREISRQRAKESRAVVASSSSWTGKLPATLLFEHCQKLKWEKVTFDAVSLVFMLG